MSFQPPKCARDGCGKPAQRLKSGYGWRLYCSVSCSTYRAYAEWPEERKAAFRAYQRRYGQLRFTSPKIRAARLEAQKRYRKKYRYVLRARKKRWLKAKRLSASPAQLAAAREANNRYYAKNKEHIRACTRARKAAKLYQKLTNTP